MLVKRLAILAISLAIGFVLTWLTITIEFVISPFPILGKLVIGAGTNLEEYGTLYTFFTTLAFGCAVAIWLDKFMGTEMLPK